MGQTSSPGSMKYSTSICSNSRDRKIKFRGVISFRNAFPIWAIPKGIFCREVPNTFLKLIKIPCAVSGRRYAMFSLSTAAPTRVSNMRLKSRGMVNVGFPDAGEGICAISSSVASTNSLNVNASISFPFISFSLSSAVACFCASFTISSSFPSWIHTYPTLSPFSFRMMGE